MPLKLTIKPEDVKASKIITPGKYRFRIQKVYVLPSKGDKSTNYVFDIIGLEGSAEGVPIKKFFNEKFISPIIPLLNALGQECSEETLTDVDLESAVNMEVFGFVETTLRDGKTPQNDINAWESVAAA